MSVVRLAIRDVERDIYGDRHGGFADAVVAALSDGPETIEQLEVALERFHAPEPGGFFRGFNNGIDDRPVDAGVVIVDLAARLVACQSTYSQPQATGCILYHDGRSATEIPVRYHLSEDWLITRDVDSWRGLAEHRRRDRAANPPLDARAVLYGPALLEFIARECLEAFRGEPPCVHQADDVLSNPNSEIPDPKWEDRPREIHARWLATPRDDLRGQAPRDIMLAGKGYIEWNLQDRAEQWSRMLRPPRPLDPSWPAFCFGGFGTHEIVTYYELVRELIWACRREVAARTGPAGALNLTAAEFLETELPRLVELRDQWLDTPDRNFGGRTPRGIIHNERIRMPEVVSAEDEMADPDCPLCQMQADMPEPGFWHLDGCNMDDDFAFSFQRTYEEWQEERRKYEEWSRRFDAEMAERERLGLKPPDGGPEAVGDGAAGSPGEGAYLRLFGVGASLCELIVALKHPPEHGSDSWASGRSPTAEPGCRDEHGGLIDRLNRDFGNLRAVCQSEDPAAADALIDPVLDRFRETLDAVAAVRADLEEQCFALQDRLAHFCGALHETDDEPG